MTLHIPKWARVVAAFSAAALGLASLMLGLSNTRTQAAPRLAGTGTDPRIEATTVQADIPISDTYPGDGVAKTVYFANASAGTITLAFQITGTPILTLTADAAFGDAEQVSSSGASPWNVNVSYSVETGVGDYAGVRYTATNTNGAQVEITISFVRDVDAPTASFSAPAAYSWISGITSIAGSASDGTGAGVQRVEIMTQTSAAWVTATGRDSWSYLWTPPAGENGVVHTLYARATDYLNQVQSPSATRVVTVDNVMTGIVSNLHSTTHTPSVWSNQATIDVAWTAASDGAGSGLAGYSVLWDTSASTNPDTVQDLAASATSTSATVANGSQHYFHIRAVDAMGNWGSTVHLGPFWVDASAPSVAIASPTSGTVLTTTHLPSYAISGTATDVGGSGISQVQVTTGTTWAAAQGTSPWTYPWALPAVDQQAFTLIARATDNATNLGTSASVPVTVDTVAPTMAAPVPDQSPWSTSTITYRWTAPADNAGIAGYSLQITSTAGYNTTFATTNLAYVFTQATTEGAGYYARVRATDRNGNVGAWSPSSIVVTPDLTAPQTSSPSIVESSAYLYTAGTRLYYINTMSISQLFAVQGYSTDALSGVNRVTFSPAFGETPSTVTSGFSPWRSGSPDYGVDPGATAQGAIAATVYDNAGNSSVQTYSYEWDSTPPVSTASAPAYATSSPITVTWMTTETQSGVQYTTLWYMKDVTGSWQAYQAIYAGSGSFSFVPPLGDGLYLFATVAVDNLGNIEAGPTVSETQTIYDTNVPQSQVTWAPTYANSSPITMTWVATPTQPQVPLAEVRLWYRLNAGTWTQTSISSVGSATSGTFSFTPSGQGTHNFATVALDTLGKSEANPSGSGDATTVYDTAAPTVAISSPTAGSVLTLTLSTFPMTGTAVDATSGITQVWVTTGTTWVLASGLSPWTYNWTLPIVDRVTYTLSARSTDNAANTGTSSSVSVIVDTVAPTASAPTPNRSPWITSTVVYTWPASSDGAGIVGYRVLITNTLGYSSTLGTSGTTLAFTQAYSQGASYYAQVQAIDRSGNAGPWSTPGTVVIPDLTAPTIASPSIGDNSPYLYVANLTLFYTNTMATSVPFTVTGTSADALSGLDRATFTRAFAQTPADDTTPAAFAGTYSISPGATASGLITATVYDQAGNASTQTYTYTLDGTMPSSTASSPVYATSSPISVTWAATDTQSGVYSTTLWYKKELTGSWQSYQTTTANSGTFSFVPPLSDGLYLFATAAADNLGNVEPRPTVSETQTVYDTKVPQSQVTWAPVYRNSSPITMTWVATPFLASLVEVRLWYRVNAGTWTQTSIYSSGPVTSGVFSFTPSTDGVHEFATVAADSHNKSEATPFGSGDASTVYDTQIAAPQGLASTPGGWARANSYAMTWSNPADLSGIAGAYYKLDSPPTAWNDGIWVPGVNRVQITGISVTGEGAHPVYVWLRDAAGNANHAARQEAALRYDASAPTGVAVVAPYKTTEIQFPVSWSANDAVSGVAYYSVEYMSTQNAIWQTWLPLTTELSALFTAPATGVDYTFRVTAYDYAGNQAQGTAQTRLVPYLKYLPVTTLKWLWWYQYDVYEPNDSPDQAFGPMVAGQVYRGYIWDAKDLSDYYWFTPSASTAAQINLTNIPAGTDYDLYVYDYQGGYRLIASSNQSGSTNEAVTFVPQVGRKYYVRVYPYSSSSSQQAYQLIATYQ